MALVSNKGKQLWRRAKEKWRNEKKDAHDKGEEFNKEEPTFVMEPVESFWAMREGIFRGTTNIRARTGKRKKRTSEHYRNEDGRLWSFTTDWHH